MRLLQFVFLSMTMTALIFLPGAAQPRKPAARAKAAASTCQSHIQPRWPVELQKAARADCDFNDRAQTQGAEAWAEAADEQVSMESGIQGRDKVRETFAKVYAHAGFRLTWYPTGGRVSGAYVVTTGRYERHILDALGHEVIGHGHYLTVWKKQKDGRYLYVWDGGD